MICLCLQGLKLLFVWYIFMQYYVTFRTVHRNYHTFKNALTVKGHRAVERDPSDPTFQVKQLTDYYLPMCEVGTAVIASCTYTITD